MLILGGEPPFNESPEPRFGAVIVKMNELALTAEQSAGNFNENVKEKLAELNANIASFVTDITTSINAHLNAQGAVHGETKATVGLGKKDNFRTATLAEHIALANVNAFVTPLGARLAIEANPIEKPDVAAFQANGVLRFASYTYPDTFPVVVPTTPEPARYFKQDRRVGILINGDRMIFQPEVDDTHYSTQTLFLSLQTTGPAATLLSEVVNLGSRYLPKGWNQVGSDSTNGQVNLFRPLADKDIYQFRTELTLPEGNRNYLLYKMFANVVYKGLGVSVKIQGQTITIAHEFFHVEMAATDPVLKKVVDNTYPATFNQIGKAPYAAPANGAHTYQLVDFVSLPEGATIEFSSPSAGAVVSLFWVVQDVEMYCNISIPLKIKKDGTVKEYTLNFTESITPGTLTAGGNAVFRQLGGRVQDIVDVSLVASQTSQWLSVTDRFNMNDPSQLPGAVLNSGEVVKALSGKYCIRVKRFRTEFQGIKDWVTARRSVADVRSAGTEIFAPARHAAFGSVPERIIPVSQTPSKTTYLAYCLNGETGRYGWSTLTWNSDQLVSSQTPDGKFGVLPATTVETTKALGGLPYSLSIVANKSSSGITLSGLAFTTANSFTGKASVSFVNGELQVGANVTLQFTQLSTLKALANGVLVRAAAANPGISPTLRTPQIHVFAVAGGKAVVVVTDGACYAEAAVTPYSLSGTVFDMPAITAGTLTLTPVTEPGQTVTGSTRTSRSGEDVQMGYSDLLSFRTSNDVYSFALPRAFGSIYGDVSFTVNWFTGTPILTKGVTNPARFFTGEQQIDMVEEIHPAILIPKKGLFQYTQESGAFSTLMNEVGGSQSMDPHDLNEAGWVQLAAGSRVVLGGETLITQKSYSVKVNPTGTTYCYLTLVGELVVAVSSSTMREVSNSEVMFGVAEDGVLIPSQSYIVMDDHLVSSERKGSSIPAFSDNGALGVNQFFTQRDVF